MAFGLDPNIALGVKNPEMPDALQAVQRVQQIQAAQQNAQLAPLRMQEAELSLQTAQDKHEQDQKDREELDEYNKLGRESEWNLHKLADLAKANPKIGAARVLSTRQAALDQDKALQTKSDLDIARDATNHEIFGQDIRTIREAEPEQRPGMLAAALARNLKEKRISPEEAQKASQLNVNDDSALNDLEMGFRTSVNMAKSTLDQRTKQADTVKKQQEQRQSDRNEFAQLYSAALTNGDITDQATHDAFLKANTPTSIKSEIGQLKVFDPAKTPAAIMRMARTVKEQDALAKDDTNKTAGDLAFEATNPNSTPERRRAAEDALELLQQKQATGDLGAYKVALKSDPKNANKTDAEITALALAARDAADIKKHIAGRSVTNVQIPGLGGTAGATNTKTGQEFLDSLPLSTRAQVQAIAEGRASIPSASARNQGAQEIRQAVFQYDPSFNEQRALARKNFAPGSKEGINIGNMNTAVVHLDQLSEAAKALNNGTFVPGNALYNSFRETFGSSVPTNFEGLKQAVAGELARGLTGSATIPEIAEISKSAASKNSPKQLADYVEEQMKVLGTKLNTKHEQYQQAVPGDTVFQVVLPSAKAVFQKHGIKGILAGGNDAANLPKGDGKVIDKDTAKQFYDAAGKDPAEAQKLAIKNGWKVQ